MVRPSSDLAISVQRKIIHAELVLRPVNPYIYSTLRPFWLNSLSILLRLPASSGISTPSPYMETYPPNGIQRNEKYVSPNLLFFENNLGPKPIENSLQKTPKDLAAIKCPSS